MAGFNPSRRACNVRFTPIADMCGALVHVRFVPIADMRPLALAALFEQSESATQRICCRFALR